MKLLLRTVLVGFLTTTAFASDEQGPVGEHTFYELDKDRSRTSSLIKSGTFDSKVLSHEPDAEGGPAYSVKMTYDLNVSLVGKRKGSEDVLIPEEYFSEDFMVRLREEGEIETESFKVRHEGFGDAELMSGEVYENCDRILIYDIETELHPGLVNFVGSLIAQQTDVGTNVMADIEDLEMRAFVSSDIDVLGAAKIDIKGKASGFNLKAGFDFVR